MKKNLFIAFLFLYSTGLYSQAKLWSFRDYQGTSLGENIFIDNGFDKFGNTFAFGYKAVGLEMFKLDSLGHLKKRIYVQGGYFSRKQIGKSVFVDPQGNIFIRFDDVVSNYITSTHILKFDNNLNLLFDVNRTYGELIDSNNVYGEFEFADFCLGFESVFLFGYSPSNNGSIILRLNQNNGDVIDSLFLLNTVISDAETNKSGIVFTGSQSNFLKGKQLLVQQCDSSLNLNWVRLYNNTPGNYLDEGNSLKMSNDNIYVTGLSENGISTYGVLVKINSLGQVQWSRKLVNGATTYQSISFDVDEALDHCYVLTDQNRMLKYNPYGTRLFDKPIVEGTFATLSTNATATSPATLLILAGYVEPNSGPVYRKYATAFLNPTDATKLYLDKWGKLCGNGVAATFENTLGKVDEFFTPARYYVIGFGECTDWLYEFPQWRHITCYNLSGGVAKELSDNFFETSSNLQLFPNPATELTTLQFISNEECEGLLAVFDLVGRKVFDKTVNINYGENNLTVDFSALQNGMYSLQLNYGGLAFYKKFIVQ